MAPEPCRHPNRTGGVVKLDFARQDDSSDGIYTASVALSICEGCGQIEVYALFPHLLCDWLKRS
jgi:hypothetical protein